MKTWRVLTYGVLLGSVLFAVIKHCAHANEPVAYATLQEAGMYGVERAYLCSHNYECGGVIALRPDGKYVVSATRTDYDGVSVDVVANGKSPFPTSWKVVADFHTHPCLRGYWTGYFSNTDADGNMLECMEGYLLDQCTGLVHHFDPATMKPEHNLDEGHATAGVIVGRVRVTGLDVSANEGY